MCGKRAFYVHIQRGRSIAGRKHYAYMRKTNRTEICCFCFCSGDNSDTQTDNDI